MENSNPTVQSFKSTAEFFGPHRRRPLPSNTFNELLKVFKICSLFPDQSLPAQFWEPVRVSDNGNDQSQHEKMSHDAQATQIAVERTRAGNGSDELAERNKNASDTMDVNNFASEKETNTKDSSMDFCKEHGGFGNLERLTNDSGLINGMEEDVNMVIDANEIGDTVAQAKKCQEDLLGIERILMDESEDMGQLQPGDKDVRVKYFEAFGPDFDTDMLINASSIAIESAADAGKLSVEDYMTDEIQGQVQRKDVEIDVSACANDVQNHPRNVPVHGGVMILPEDAGRTNDKAASIPGTEDNSIQENVKEREEVKGNVSDIAATGKTKKAKGNVSDKSGTRKTKKDEKTTKKDRKSGQNRKQVLPGDRVGTVPEDSVCMHEKEVGKLDNEGNSIRETVKEPGGKEKRNETEMIGKSKTKKGEKEGKDGRPVKNKKQVSPSDEICNILTSHSNDSVAYRKSPMQNATGKKGKSPARETRKDQTKISEHLRYTRDQLLQLRKVVSIPSDILKVKQDIDAALLTKNQKNTNHGESHNAGVSDKRDGGPIREDEVVKDNSKLKDKRRRSTSEAKKEKKKEKKRKQRAEKNRKLGVKRLKLKPVLKPKVVAHCRHYLNGRCQEGEKCKFSHDVIPLTKSKPCCHFARQSCMKGDDCPYDHQLSKYPCNTFVSSGFCTRGPSCLFSHKMPVKEPSELSNTLKPDVKSLASLDNSTTNQHPHPSTSLPSPRLIPKNSKPDIENRAQNHPPRTPKGFTFISSQKSLMDDSTNKNHSSSKSVNIFATGSEPEKGVSSTVLNSGEILKGTQASVTRRGISFLSFDKPSVSNSAEKERGKMPIHSEEFAGKFQNPKLTTPELQPSAISSAKSMSDPVQRALLSTFAFAARYDSGSKPSHLASSSVSEKEPSKNGETGSSSGSGSGERKPMNASSVLTLLYGGGSENK